MSESKIVVTVPMHCSRKGKDYQVSLPLAEAQPFVERQQLKTAAAESIKGALEQLGEKIPDLIVSYRGQTFILPSVHSKNDDSIHRLVNDLLQKDVYTLKDPKPRAKKSEDAAE